MNEPLLQPKGGNLLIVAGHAVYASGSWRGGFPGEDSFYGHHVEAGVELLIQGRYQHLIFSGGNTRPRLEAETGGRSEAEGMQAFAVERGWIQASDPRVMLETWARDSFENTFYSLLAFHRHTGEWPARVGVISWNSKALRFHLIASGLRLGGRIFFHGVGDYPTQADLERACAAEARFNAALVDLSHLPPSYRLVDPLLRNEMEFAQKRRARMPRQFTPDPAGNRQYVAAVKSAYAANRPAIAELIDQVERTQPGQGWREIAWPWLGAAGPQIQPMS